MVNSWHEMPMSEYFWYYNMFVAGPEWLLAADWILYVSNRDWGGNAEKEQRNKENVARNSTKHSMR